MQHVTITSTCYFMRYRRFSLSLAWFGAICNALSCVTVKFIKEYTFFKKKSTVMRGKALQIAQNQANLGENSR